MHSHFFKSETETSKTRSLCTKVGPLRLGWAQLLCSPARRVAASSPRVQGWYNCVSAQRGAECCLNINKLSHSRETPALVTTLTRNTSPPAAAGGSFHQHFQFSSTSFCWTQTLPFERGVFQPPSRTASSPAKLNHFTL